MGPFKPHSREGGLSVSLLDASIRGSMLDFNEVEAREHSPQAQPRLKALISEDPAQRQKP